MSIIVVIRRSELYSLLNYWEALIDVVGNLCALFTFLKFIYIRFLGAPCPVVSSDVTRANGSIEKVCYIVLFF